MDFGNKLAQQDSAALYNTTYSLPDQRCVPEILQPSTRTSNIEARVPVLDCPAASNTYDISSRVIDENCYGTDMSCDQESVTSI